MVKASGWARAGLVATGTVVAAGLAALPWLCMKAGLLTHVGVPAFGMLVLADAIIVAAILWRVVTGRP